MTIAVDRILYLSIGILACLVPFLFGPYKRLLISFMFILLFFSLALLRSKDVSAKYQKLPIKQVIAFRFRVASTPLVKSKSYALMGEIVNFLDYQGRWHKTKSLGQFYLDKKAKLPQIGETYLSTIKLQSIRPSAFPFGQNWPQYYARKGIYVTAYLPSQSFILESYSKEFSWRLLFDRWQKIFVEHLHRGLQSDRNQAVASTMLLSAHEAIDFETQKTYAALGAIHILSVSGMHVGILWMCIQFLLKFIPFRGPTFRFLNFMIPLCIIWVYAGITGFSAPVLRASGMFTVLFFARNFRFNENSINLLSFTAFVLLVWNPLQLFDVGFQLSFLAVLGILLFNTPLQSIWTPKSKNFIISYLLESIWSITTVAISAQLLSFPWILFYFHQFPHVGVLLFANPFLTLFSSLSLILGMLFLTAAPLMAAWGFMSIYHFLAKIFEFSLNCLHDFMFWVDTKFHPTIPFLHWESWMTYAYYGILLLGILWWRIRYVLLLKIGILLLTISVLVYQWGHWNALKHQQFAYLAQYKGMPVWLTIQGLKAQLIGPAQMKKDPPWIQSSISPVLAHHFVRDTTLVFWREEINYSWHWKGKLFYFAQHAKMKIPKVMDVLVIPSQLKRDVFKGISYHPTAKWIWTHSFSGFYLHKFNETGYLPAKQFALDSMSAISF
ncbi:ComEC/Rec2 family competence protein [Aquirufa rosea]|uniref:ComEC family competence protein n=1 Tax=Aquirufa rosea TaxID=2509241 RepID=A0A4V1M5B5_9BACT|nr:ComEC/Rec2 family competence protein [Aquirufa rosea]RXK48146.1 ComEC family competence protein [Aquirufa rosea]